MSSFLPIVLLMFALAEAMAGNTVWGLYFAAAGGLFVVLGVWKRL